MKKIGILLLMLSVNAFAQRPDIIIDNKYLSNKQKIYVDYNSANALDSWAKRSGVDGSEFKTITYALSLFTTNNGNPFFGKKGFTTIVVRGVGTESVTISKDSLTIFGENNCSLNSLQISGGTEIKIYNITANTLQLNGAGVYSFDNIKAATINITNLSSVKFNNCLLLSSNCSVTGTNDISFINGSSPNITCNTNGSIIRVKNTITGGTINVSNGSYELVNATYTESGSNISGTSINNNTLFSTGLFSGLKSINTANRASNKLFATDGSIFDASGMSGTSGNFLPLTFTNNQTLFGNNTGASASDGLFLIKSDLNNNIITANWGGKIGYNSPLSELNTTPTSVLYKALNTNDYSATYSGGKGLKITNIPQDAQPFWIDSKYGAFSSSEGVVTIVNDQGSQSGANGDVTFFQLKTGAVNPAIGDGITTTYSIKGLDGTGNTWQSARHVVVTTNSVLNDINKHSAVQRFYVTHNLSERLGLEVYGEDPAGVAKIKTQGVKHFNYTAGTATDGFWKTDGTVGSAQSKLNGTGIPTFDNTGPQTISYSTFSSNSVLFANTLNRINEDAGNFTYQSSTLKVPAIKTNYSIIDGGISSSQVKSLSQTWGTEKRMFYDNTIDAFVMWNGNGFKFLSTLRLTNTQLLQFMQDYSYNSGGTQQDRFPDLCVDEFISIISLSGASPFPTTGFPREYRLKKEASIPGNSPIIYNYSFTLIAQ